MLRVIYGLLLAVYGQVRFGANGLRFVYDTCTSTNGLIDSSTENIIRGQLLGGFGQVKKCAFLYGLLRVFASCDDFLWDTSELFNDALKYH